MARRRRVERSEDRARLLWDGYRALEQARWSDRVDGGAGHRAEVVAGLRDVLPAVDVDRLCLVADGRVYGAAHGAMLKLAGPEPASPDVPGRPLLGRAEVISLEDWRS